MKLLFAGSYKQAYRIREDMIRDGETEKIEIVNAIDPSCFFGIERGTEIMLRGTYERSPEREAVEKLIHMRFLKVI